MKRASDLYDKAKVTQKDYCYKLEFRSLTQGELMSLENALDMYSNAGSMVAQDVLGYLKTAMKCAGINSCTS